MVIPLLILALAATVWGLALARRMAVLDLALATVVIAYVLGHSFWNKHLGPLPLTLDRLLLGYTLAIFAWRFWRGDIRRTPLVGLDWVLLAYLGLMTVSWFVSRPDGTVHLPTSPFWRLFASFGIPAILYGMLRQTELNGSTARRAMWVLAGLGIYLGFTALAETAQQWWAVFPRYISDPLQGLHYGRARGPMLNSVSLGIYLSVCLWAAWLLIPGATRSRKVMLLAAVGLMAFSVLLTFTRSTWIGLAGSGVVVLTLQLPPAWRLPALGSMLGAGVLLLAVGWEALLHVQREDRGEVSAHSVQQRESFLYVSMKMFHDHPLWGVGFGRFYDQKMPYLSDRRQSFELESIRPLHHHNTFLGFLTETGLAGLALFLAVLGGFARSAWRLFNAEGIDPDVRRLSLLLFGALVIYVSSAAFHDLTLVASEEWLLFSVAGLAVGYERRLAVHESDSLENNSNYAWNSLGRAY